MQRLKNIKPTKSFYYTFSLIFAVVLILFVVFSVYTYTSSRQALQHEFLSYSMTQLQSISSTVENRMMDMRYVMATLDLSSSAQTFMNLKDPDILFPNNNRHLSEQLKAYRNVFPYLDSIYIYSPATNSVLTHDNIQAKSLRHFTDNNWVGRISDASQQVYLLFRRQKNDMYPYLVTLLKARNTAQGLGAICVNVDISKIDPLPAYSGRSNEKIYIISDDGQIIYHIGQREFQEPLSSVPRLTHFDGSADSMQLFVDGSQPYIYTQLHSEDYPWSYVLLTDITDYTARVSGSTNFISTILIFLFVAAVLLIFIIVFRSTRPISAIIRLLDSPDQFTYTDISDAENRRIIQTILTYIQTNSSLSEELEQQLVRLNDAKLMALQSQINPHFLMNTLNMIRMLEIEELGFDHKVPNMTLMLSRLLQYALDSTDYVSVNTELYHAEQFTRILNYRYQNALQFDFSIQEEVRQVIVPKLIIQPLIENAVFHGLSLVQDGRDKFVRVSMGMEEDQCLMVIEDNGAGIEAKKLQDLLEEVSNYDKMPKSSIGLRNVILRMHLLYGDDFSFSIESEENKGTVITLRFPGTSK